MKKGTKFGPKRRLFDIMKKNCTQILKLSRNFFLGSYKLLLNFAQEEEH